MECVQEFIGRVYGVAGEMEAALGAETAATNGTPEGLDALRDLLDRALNLDLQMPLLFKLNIVQPFCIHFDASYQSK